MTGLTRSPTMGGLGGGTSSGFGTGTSGFGTGTSGFGTGSSGFGTGSSTGSGFGFGNKGGGLSFGLTSNTSQEGVCNVDEAQPISDIPSDAQKKFLDLHNTVREFEKTVLLGAADSLTDTLSDLENSVRAALKHSLVKLGSEIDSGTLAIDDYRARTGFLELYAPGSSTVNDSSHSKSALVLSEQMKAIDRWQVLIKDAIARLELREQGEVDMEQLAYAIKEEHAGITRCAARLAKLKDKVAELMNARSEKGARYKDDTFEKGAGHRDDIFEEGVKDGDLELLIDWLDAENKSYLEQRTKDLNKRIDSEDVKSSLVQQQQTTGGFGFGSSTGFGSSGFGKSTFGSGTSGFGSGTSGFGSGTSGFGSGTSGFGKTTTATGTGK